MGQVEFSIVNWLFLLAYTCSGMAGLIYEVTWTRLLTLYVGHTTAAASAVVAAFLGGLAVGASIAGSLASRLSPGASLRAYIALEIFVAFVALALPFELQALTPLLRWSYQNGDSAILFPAVRVTVCLALVFIPATALGATFPLAIHWFARRSPQPARMTGVLYALNTVGAAIGALLAGFTLIPAIGLTWTTRVGVAGSLAAAACVWIVLCRASAATTAAPLVAPKPSDRSRRARLPKVALIPTAEASPLPAWLPAAILGVSGCASLVHEIVWTRILALLLGPTTYAFAATLAAVISGVAAGSAVGTWIVGKTRHPIRWLAFSLAGAALTASWTSSLAGGWVPGLVARQMAASAFVLDQLFRQGTLLTAALILPTALCFGAAFPLALALSPGASSASDAKRFGLIYAVNTLGAVSGSLLAGFVFIPMFGLQTTLRLVSVVVIGTAGAVLAWGRVSRATQWGGAVIGAMVLALTFLSPAWDRDLLASGSYLYAPYVPKHLDLETLLKAGTLLYYREGASATVSVKRLTGTTTLAVDGKVDASNRSDMLTQKLIAHLPLLLHEQPRTVGIIGLGSGVTLGAALSHPIERADVIEISPEVVEASRFFVDENRQALTDPRTHLIVGDGRSHLLLTEQKYDVIVSEPSNPWIAGVAALFTQEFFSAARERLAPGGIICQWAHTYNINEGDLRSIAATFTSVFPNGTLWLVGGDDLLLLASEEPMDGRLANIERAWQRAEAVADLKRVAVSDPFSMLSLYGGGPAELAAYGTGAPPLTDDRMTLEFSGPRELHRSSAGDNDTALFALYRDEHAPAIIRAARAAATAVSWRHRAEMMAKSDMHDVAYDDYVRALTKDPDDEPSLDQIVREALLIRRVPDALGWVRGVTMNRPPTVPTLIALSKLLAANGMRADALDAATHARELNPGSVQAAAQLAAIYSDTDDLNGLDAALASLSAIAPDHATTLYYTAVSRYLHDDAKGATETAMRAIARDPNVAAVYDLLGAAQTRLGQLDEARNAFLKSLTFDAHDSAAYANLGVIELAAGHPDAAAAYFAEALSLDPDSALAQRELARLRR